MSGGSARVVSPALLVLITFLVAQPSGQPLNRSTLDLVEVDVSVMRGNAAVGGLRAENFILTDNGVRQQVKSALTDLPLRVTLVVDVSQSMAGRRLAALVSAGDGLAAALLPQDRIALITFSHQVRLMAPMGPPSAVRERLPELSASGATALRDAVQVGLASQLAERHRSLLLLLTDGLDSGSWLSEEQLEASARRSNTVIHAMRFEDDRFLDRLTAITGGRTWNVESERQLQQMFLQALQEMRARYVLTYEQEGTRTPGWHEIKVTLRNARGDVTARRGYNVD